MSCPTQIKTREFDLLLRIRISNHGSCIYGKLDKRTHSNHANLVSWEIVEHNGKKEKEREDRI